MRKIVLSTVFALGLGLAGATGATAAPFSPVPGAAPTPMVTPAQLVVVGPRYRHRRYCYNARRCWRGRHGRLVCRVHRVCRWR